MCVFEVVKTDTKQRNDNILNKETDTQKRGVNPDKRKVLKTNREDNIILKQRRKEKGNSSLLR